MPTRSQDRQSGAERPLFVAQSLNQQGKGGSVLAAAGVVEMVAVKCGTIRLQHSRQTPLADGFLYGVFRNIGESQTGLGGVQALGQVIQG